MSLSKFSENNNITSAPPKLNIELPKRRDIGKTRVDWSYIESELPTDLLLVTVKDHEFVSCYHYLQDVKRSLCNGLGMVDFGTFGDGGVKVAMIQCQKGSTEPHASLSTVKTAVQILRPKAVVCVGYCATLSPAKAKLGDVVISTKLGTYSNKKITRDGTVELRGVKPTVSRGIGTLIPTAADGWIPPYDEQESNFEVEVHREAVLLSGPELVDNFERRQELLQHYPDAIATEMEGEGLYAAAHGLGMEWAVIKGISDLADGSKASTADWQPFASAMAASVVHNMFKYPDVLHHWPHYKTPDQGMENTSNAITPPVSGAISFPIQDLLKSIGGTKEGKRMYNGRTIEYSVSGRIHSLREPWVYDATAKDVASEVRVLKKHFNTADEAISKAIEELMKELQERKIMPE